MEKECTCTEECADGFNPECTCEECDCRHEKCGCGCDCDTEKDEI